MFNFFKKTLKNNNLKTKIFNLEKLECATCAVDIDLALEELPSVSSKTSYAKSTISVSFNPNQTTISKIKSLITKMGYQVS